MSKISSLMLGLGGLGLGAIAISACGATDSIASAPPGATALSAPPTNFNFSSTSFEGGGFQNVVAISPAGTVLTAADISGVQRATVSASSNDQFFGRSQGLCGASGCGGDAEDVATVVYDAATRAFYVGTGNDGGGGGVFQSSDDGKTWVSLCTGSGLCPQFSGNHSGKSSDPQTGKYQLPDDHPRMTGTLIAVANGGKTLFAATERQGLLRWTSATATWTVIGLTGNTRDYLRGVAYDSGSDTLYVADYGNGVFQFPHAQSCTAPCTPNLLSPSSGALAGHLDYVEELALIAAPGASPVLYAAAGNAGVYRYNGSGTSWTALNGAAGSALDAVCATPGNPASTCGSSAVYMSIAGYVSGGNTVLFAGNVPAHGGKALFVSGDGGASWTPLGTGQGSGQGQYTTNVLGAVNDPWWLGSPTGFAPFLIDGHGYVASFIAINPSDLSVIVAGRSGAWMSTDCTAANNYRCHFAPLVHDMNVTNVHGFAVDGLLVNGSYHAYVGDHDFGFMVSSDQFKTTIERNLPPASTSAQLEVAQVALDDLTHAGDPMAGPSEVVAGVTSTDFTSFGDVFVNPDPTDLTSTWTPLAMGSAPCGGGVLRVAVGHPGGAGTGRVIVAARNGCGLWRCTGPNTCQQTATTPTHDEGANEAGHGGFLWTDPLKPTIYFYDATQGLFVSNTGGNSWSGPVWPVTSGPPHTGYLAADPTGRYIFASVGSGTCSPTSPSNCGIWQIDTQNNFAALKIAGPDIGNLTVPGPIAVDPWGRLWATDLVANVARLGFWTNPAGATAALGNPTRVSGPIYAGASNVAGGVVIGADGTLYIEEATNGLLRGDPSP